MNLDAPYLLRSAAFSVLFMCFSSSAWADQPIAKIEGDISGDLEELIVQVLGEVDAPARSLAQARRRAETAAAQTKSVLRSQAYYSGEINARVEEFSAEGESKKRRAPQPVLNIKPGPQFKFSDISVAYDGAAPDIAEKIIKTIALPRGEPAVADRVVAAELRAVNLLKASGYPDAIAEPRKAVVDHDTATMDVTYNISVGEKTRFGEIEQTGTAYLVKSWPRMIAPLRPATSSMIEK